MIICLYILIMIYVLNIYIILCLLSFCAHLLMLAVFSVSLWHPQSCNVCMTHYRTGWVNEDIEPALKAHAIDSL